MFPDVIILLGRRGDEEEEGTRVEGMPYKCEQLLFIFTSLLRLYLITYISLHPIAVGGSMVGWGGGGGGGHIIEFTSCTGHLGLYSGNVSYIRKDTCNFSLPSMGEGDYANIRIYQDFCRGGGALGRKTQDNSMFDRGEKRLFRLLDGPEKSRLGFNAADARRRKRS